MGDLHAGLRHFDRLFLRFLLGPGGAVWLQQGEPALILLLYEFSSLGERV